MISYHCLVYLFKQVWTHAGQIKYSGVMVLTQYCEIFAAGHVPCSVCTPHNYQCSHCTSYSYIMAARVLSNLTMRVRSAQCVKLN